MNFTYSKSLAVRIYRKGLCNYLFKSLPSYNFRCYNSCSQICTEIEHSNPLQKIGCLFIQQRYGSTLQEIKKIQVENISKYNQEQKNLLFNSCGKLLSNRSLEFRRKLCEEVLEKFKSAGDLTVVDCNMYIQICTENEKEVDFKHFLTNTCVEPNEETYKLLIENACELGNVEKAYEIVEMMKGKCAMDERVLNALMLGNTIKSGFYGSEMTLSAMKEAHILSTSNTYWSMLKGLALRDDKQEFLNALSKLSLVFDDMHFMQLLFKLGLHNGQGCLPALKEKLKIEKLPMKLTNLFEHLCTSLIYRSKALAAIEIYRSLIEPNCDNSFLLKEIVKSDSYDGKSIVEIGEYLVLNGIKERAFEDFYDFSMRYGRTEISWDLLEHLDHVRPHYFWPLILKAAEENGELGVLDTLVKMQIMNVEINFETLELYVLPHCDLSKPKNLIDRLQVLELPLKRILTPIVTLLLQENRVKDAYDLCITFKTGIEGSRVITALASSWVVTKDSRRCIELLKHMWEMNESSVDITGSTLLHISRLINDDNDYEDFSKLLKDLRKQKLVITPLMNKSIQRKLHYKGSLQLFPEIRENLNSLVDMSVVQNPILHPRDMALKELECHLIELQSKNKETRGVLRRLMQMYAKEGNNAKVIECFQMLKKAGYEFSPGMKSSVLHSYIKSYKLNEALSVFEDLQKNHHDFRVDHYKVIDLAMLMVESNQVENARNFMKKELKSGIVRDTAVIEKNCWRLLSCYKNPIEAIQTFQLLIERGYCKPTNVMLGPIVRSYLNGKDYDGAVKFYVHCTKEYKCTPLQLELLHAAVDEENEHKLREIIEATAKVHGLQNTQIAFLAALAEKGFTASLNKLILDIKVVPRHLLQLRCNRWVKQGKIHALITLSNAIYRLPSTALDGDLIFESIGQIYVNNNDCESALKYCRSLIEREIKISKKLAKELTNLFVRNKIRIPDDLVNYIRM